MILKYDMTTFNITSIAPGLDSGIIAEFTASLGPNEATFTVAVDLDDAINFPTKYCVNVALNDVQLKNYISLLYTGSTIDLSDTSILTIQLKQSDGVTNLNEAHAITLSPTGGILTNGSITTDGSGAAQSAFKPNKVSGVFTTLATAPRFFDGNITVTINTPATAADQTWLESADIKTGAVTDAKLAKVTPTQWWFISNAFVRTTFDASYDGSSINSVVSDGEGFIYVNGLVAAVPTITKVDTNDGTQTTLTYTNHNLADALDIMTYDGENVWVPSNNDILKVTASTMTLASTVNIGTGKVESSAWDGNLVYAWLNTASAVSRLYSITKAGTKAGIGSPINPFTGAHGAIVVVDKKFIHVVSDNAGAAFLDRVSPASYAAWTLTASGSAAANGTVNYAAASTGTELWIGGDGGIDVVMIDGTQIGYGLTVATIPASTTNQILTLYFDGSSMWAIRTTSSGSTTGRYLSKLSRDGATINIDQTIDLTTTVNPSPITSDGTNVYVGAFGTTTKDITKVFIGR